MEPRPDFSASSAVFEAARSPQIRQKVSVTTTKTPSKRSLAAIQPLDLFPQINILEWLPEVKQFVSFFNIHFYENQLKQRFTRLLQTLITLEPKRNCVSAPLLSQQPQAQQQPLLAIQKVQTLTQELFELIQETIARADLPSNIQKGTLRTVAKLFKYKRSLVVLLKRAASATDVENGRPPFRPALFLKTLFECQFDTHDTHQEEIILLTIQKIVIQMTKHFSDVMKGDEVFKNCVYFFRVLRKRAINDRQMTSLHMQEGTKQNMNKLFAVIAKKQDSSIPPAQTHRPASEFENPKKYRNLKRQVFHMFARKLLKNIKKMEAPVAGQASQDELAIRREYVCSILKASAESFQAFSRQPGCASELTAFIAEEKEILFQVMCRAGELQDIAVRNMAQLFFSQFLQQVLDLGVPFREELEVLYVKLLLKPLELLDDKLTRGTQSQTPAAHTGSADKDRVLLQSPSRAPKGEFNFLSDEDDTDADEARNAAQAAASGSQTSNDPGDCFELEASLNHLIETLLALQPEHLAQMFLVYDCQPLSQNLIRRSLYLILRFSQLLGRHTDLTQTFQVVGLIVQSLQRYDSPAQKPSIDAAGLRNMQGILEMLELKKKARRIAISANMKPKAFFASIEESFEGIGQLQQCQLAAKVLLNSRRVSLDKIAEIIGGKDDRAKQCLEEYLERQDYSECSIEQSMRGFLQTFRMAGVDSQVVFNILEKFGHKYYEKDHSHLFTSGAEAYNFAYLIIVLQTCQHNAAIKDKTTLERFFGQAKEMVPESYDQLPEGMVEGVFQKITKNEIKAPITRDLIKGFYEIACGQQEIAQRTVTAVDPGDSPLSESDLLSTADLREKQLFDMHNRILGVAPESLQLAALRQLINMLTAKFVSIRQKVGDGRFNSMRTLELTKQLIASNAHFSNNEWVDRLMLDYDRQVDQFCRIQKPDDKRRLSIKTEQQNLFWSNFKALRLATGLITKMAPPLSRSSIHYASFNAVEVKIRNKFNQSTPSDGLLTQLWEGADQCGDSDQRLQPPVTITPIKQGAQVQILSPDPKKGSQQNVATQRQQSGLFNMVYNYFTPVPTEAEEEARKREYIMSGQNQIDLLKQQLDDFNSSVKSGAPENVSDSYFFDFLLSKGIETSDALRQIAQFIKANMNSRRAGLCLSYLYCVYLDSASSLDVETRMHVQHTILSISQNLVHRITNRDDAKSPATGSGVHSRQSSFGNISLTTQEEQHSDSQDETVSQRSDSTAEHQVERRQTQQNLASRLLREPKKSQFEAEIATWVNKHLILELYFSVMGSWIVSDMTTGATMMQQTDARPTSNDLIKDVQKTLVALSECELTREDFEQAFIFEKIAEFIQPTKLTADDLNKTGEGGLDDFEESQKSHAEEEEEKRGPARKPASLFEGVPMLPLREYPKIRKFLHLLFILMVQQSTGSKFVSNEDQLQVALTKLLKAISHMFLLQETVPYDQINRSLDVLVKNSGPFKTFHELSSDYLEDLLAICQTYFLLLERGSDGKEQKLFQKGQFDLWFKTMGVLTQKILLSPYIELYKSIQERTCTLVKIQILTFQFQPLTTNSESPAAAQMRAQTKLIFEELMFTLSIAALQNQRDWLHQRLEESHKLRKHMASYRQSWEDDQEGFAHLCQLCVNTETDVFIQYAQQLAQESESSADSYDMFTILWNKFMLVLLNYADATESLLIDGNEVVASALPLQQSIQDNIQRVMEFLLAQRLLLESTSDNDSPVAQAKVQLYKKTQAALGLFWQEVTIKQTPA